MNIITRLALGLAGWAIALGAHAAPQAALGQTLSATEIQQLGVLPEFRAGPDHYRLLPQKTEDGQGSLLLDERGAVVASHHEVMITQAAEDQVRAALRQGPSPSIVQHFAPTGITVVRYDDFAQTIAGLKALQTGLPDATVRLSIVQSRKKPY
ncbi:MAG TPA: hypothetical protein VL024_08985 [Castellaniella sp.]|nr:hypothetical protein [Castellaniella sp.]